MSFSLDFDELPNSYQSSGGSYSGSAGRGWGHSLGSLATGEEASTPNATGSPTAISFPVCGQM